MNRLVNTLAGRMSLRKPQREALEILARVTELAPPEKGKDLQESLRAIQQEFPTLLDFEREFVSLCFALATGVGKTRLMGAFISYLYKQHGLKNFFVLAPNLTIYNKLIVDFTPNTPKYVFKGVDAFAVEPPAVITGDNYEGQARTLFDELLVCKINIFNISKLNSEVRGGKSPRIRRLSEYIGESYFDYLSKLPDLVLLMDESHRYRASSGVKVLNELKPILGLELTATPYMEGSKETVAFKNVVYSYALGKAIEDGLVKDPAVVTRKDFNPDKLRPEELEKLKLEDGIRLHEMTKVELETYARESGKARVKPFVLVIARDTAHATALLEVIKADSFFDGRYKEKVIQVDSSKKGQEAEEEMVTRLLGVEKTDDPTEIVIHVNMLKEGWDVTNLYTIVPLRAANAKILIEQSIGRGLRLPYGARTGTEAVDRLNIIAHDRFQEIVDEARKPGSAVQVKALALEKVELEEKKKSVLSQSALEESLGIKPEGEAMPSGVVVTSTPRGEAALAFPTAKEQRIAQATYEVSRGMAFQPEKVPTTASLQRPEIRAEIERQVKEKLKPQQMELEGILEEPIAEVVKKTLEMMEEKTIDIPKISVVPKGLKKKGYRPFQLNLEALRYPPVEEILWMQYLRTGEGREIRLSGEGEEERLENYVIRGLIDLDEVNYDGHAEILQDLAGQVVRHLEGYLKDRVAAGRVLCLHQREIARYVYAQMKEHSWEEAEGYEAKVTRGFTDFKPSAYTVSDEEIADVRQVPKDKGKIGKMLFGGFQRGLYAVTKFQSDTERRFALLLERDALKWFRPAKGQFSMYYKGQGGDEPEYTPDFVAETTEGLFLFEIKAANEMGATDVLEKKKAAIEWCKYATEYNKRHGRKPWTYALIPHDDVKENMSLLGLIVAWKREPEEKETKMRKEVATALHWQGKGREKSFAEIEKTASVLGGNARIRGTRLAVWFLATLRHLGQTDEQILKSYPQLSPKQLAEAWEYAALFSTEIEGEMKANEEE